MNRNPVHKKKEGRDPNLKSFIWKWTFQPLDLYIYMPLN